MTGTTEVARRNGAAPAQQTAALAIRNNQAMWDDRQTAALVSLGIPQNAPKADLAVFLHQAQRTGLDPFTKQIYLIYRNTYENGKSVSKPTMQVGIDGYRLIRDRIAKREGMRVEYEDTVWYGDDGTPCDVWLWDEPPAACRVVVKVDGRRFASVLRFKEYAQYKKNKDGTQELNTMWRTKSAHMIEKCCEADALRRAFPQDLSGLVLEDAAPAPEDAPPAVQRPRVTPEQARGRTAPQAVTATVVTPNAASGEGPAPAAPEAASAERPPARIASGQKAQIDTGEVPGE